MPEKETRQLTTDFEVRSEEIDGQKQTVIEGYALKFNRWSDVLGDWFKEIISPDALRETDMSNVVALFNHSDDKVLGRTGVNLELEVDGIGLKFRVKPTNTTYANDLIENMRSGIINQCSFAMSGIESDWAETDEENVYSRTITRIGKLWDVSVVTNPAYPDTEAVIGARSKEEVEKLLQIEVMDDEVEWLDFETI